MRESDGGRLKDAHIRGLYSRICKLLHFGIKPVFIFDGVMPNLKRDTLSKRNKQRSTEKKKMKEFAKKLLFNKIHQEMINDPSIQSKIQDKDHIRNLINKISKQENKSENEKTKKLKNVIKENSEEEQEEQEMSPPEGVDALVFYSLPKYMQKEVCLQKETENSNFNQYSTPKRRNSQYHYSQEHLIQINKIMDESSVSPIQSASNFSAFQLESILSNLSSQSEKISPPNISKRIASDSQKRYAVINSKEM